MNRILWAVVLAGVAFYSIGSQQCEGGEIAVQWNPNSYAEAESSWGAEYNYQRIPAGPSGGHGSSAGAASTGVFWNVTSQGATATAWANGIGSQTPSPLTDGALSYLTAGFSLTTNGQNTPLSIRYNTDGISGTYVGTTAGLSVSAGSFGGSSVLHSSNSLIWTDDGRFPGEREKPRDYSAGNKDTSGEDTGDTIWVPGGDEDPNMDDGAVVANDTTGGYLTSLPVGGSFGVTAPVYFGGQPAAAPTPGVGPGTVDYYFRSLSNANFTSFIAPDGIAGDTSQIVVDDGTTLTPYVPGTTHVFSTPIHVFALRGLDDAAMPGSGPAPFVHGLTFDSAGAAVIVHGEDLAPRSEGNFDRNRTIDGADLLVWQRTLGRAGRGLGGDGDGDELVTSLDLAVWKTHFAPSASVTSTAVPEPSTLSLVALAAGRRLRRRRAVLPMLKEKGVRQAL